MVPVSIGFHLCDAKEHSGMETSPKLCCGAKKIVKFVSQKIIDILQVPCYPVNLILNPVPS